jgi:hypothetical protein
LTHPIPGLDQRSLDSRRWCCLNASVKAIPMRTTCLIFSADADGTINMADGSKVDFVDVERVQW